MKVQLIISPPIFSGVLYFNTSNVKVQHIYICSTFPFKQISIHPMWRFSFFPPLEHQWYFLFQYIQCEGSAPIRPLRVRDMSKFQYIQCEGSAQRIRGGVVKMNGFQYIQCEGSAHYLFCQLLFEYLISIHPMWRFSFMT